ncbi:hypothetical protein QCA50_004478 [Cerrena zonata]|uniref:CST complex subunit Stn1 N-terminal domain-containing protein n=1 Tax=Cerrena zonata TaxID=2478898 RepID=A0AAW0GHK6_9APHY
MEPAIPTRLRDVSTKKLPMKVRVAGRVSSYDVASSTMILSDEDDNVLIDVSLCVDPYVPSTWLREAHTLVVAMGYLEQTPKDVRYLRSDISVSKATKKIIFRALLVREANDLQLSSWYKAIEERQKLTSRAES